MTLQSKKCFYVYKHRNDGKYHHVTCVFADSLMEAISNWKNCSFGKYRITGIQL